MITGEKLAADGGEHIECGWLKDSFGMPRQIVPAKVWDWLRGDDPARVQLMTAASQPSDAFAAMLASL